MSDPLDHLPWLDEEGEPIRKLTITELVKVAPAMLTWSTEPETRAGDLIVFDWIRHHWVDPTTGAVMKTEYPGVAMRVMAHPVRHRKGHWQAPYAWQGLDRAEYLARGAGVTGDPRRSPDPEAEVIQVKVTATQRELNRIRAEERRTEIGVAGRDRRPWGNRAA